MSENKNISITVPMDYRSLKAASDMFLTLANGVGYPEELEEVIKVKPPITDADALADLNGEPRPDNPSPEAKEVFATPETTSVTPPPPSAPEFPRPEHADTVAADLDKNGLPWDERIHSKAKGKDVKGNWKYLRGVDRDVLVPQVEAELRAMMGEDTPEPVTEAPAATPQPPVTPSAPATTAPSASVTTFAQLVTGITTNQIPEERVNAVIANVGLSNFALLGARADLIPTVAGHLGL